jgi:DNA polymerase-4
MRKIIHIDMDCFFAAVEMRDNPALREVPLAIGGAADRRGVISTCNYVARRFGVRSAMPSALARKLCPPLVLIPGRMAVYKETSRQLRAIFLRYTEQVEPLSLDEAYLDVTQSPRCGGSATMMAAEIRAAISAELGLTASAGVAPNKFLAKLASEQRKPDGLFVIRPQEVDEFVRQLPLGKLPGIGRKTAERLESLGLYSCEDARQLGNEELIARFGKLGEMLAGLLSSTQAWAVCCAPWAFSSAAVWILTMLRLSSSVTAFCCSVAVAIRVFMSVIWVTAPLMLSMLLPASRASSTLSCIC